MNDLNKITTNDLLVREKASGAALQFIGNSDSALHSLWYDAILKRRGIPLFWQDLHRIEGGNQRMTDTLAAKLGDQVRLGCPVTSIRRGDSGVQVGYREFGRNRTTDADYLVCTMPAVMLRQIPVTPDWPEYLRYTIGNVPYYSVARVVLQSRTPFWEADGVSPNIIFGAAPLRHVWRMADEVRSTRGLLMGTGQAGTTAARNR